MKNSIQLAILIYSIAFLCTGCQIEKKQTQNSFVTINKGRFHLNERPYTFLGTNFWYGMNLGDPESPQLKERLVRELDRLQKLGVNNLRIMAGSEGPDSEPYRMVPSLQRSPGIYNENLLLGLDYLLDELKKRDMRAVVCLSDFWNWSGGFGQYIVWSGQADAIPYPPPHPNGTWDQYQKFVAKFYSNSTALKMFDEHVKKIVGRKNSVNSILYAEDPVIMAWELCNEPRAIDNREGYLSWIKKTSHLIKSLDKNHLVTIGSEGKTSSAFAATIPYDDHNFDDIDYQTIHIWVQNWDVYDPMRANETFDSAVAYALNYINEHELISRKLGKPLVLEEFGISRDMDNHSAETSTAIRDRYYQKIFQAVHEKIASGSSPLQGCNFWAWGGEGRPREPKTIWRAGDDFIGDPPHEFQGWYSVFDTDSSTLKVIQEYTLLINSAGNDGRHDYGTSKLQVTSK